MKKFFKWGLISFAAILILLVGGLGLLIWTGKHKTDDVRTMCGMPVGTAIEQVMKTARDLNFSESDQGVLGSGLVVFAEGQKTPLSWNDDNLPGIKSGKIKVGKTSLPPFMRNYCELSFNDRKVTSTRTWTLD